MKKLRKNPLQTRSQNLLEAIIESSARILPALGYARATTNRIAKKAGISIGSLYQYFPHKDAIFASLLDRELNKQMAEVDKILEAQDELTLNQLVDILVERFYVLYMGRKELSRELFINVAKIDQLNEMLYVRNRIVDTLSMSIAKYKNLDIKTARSKAFVCLNAFMGIIQTATLVKELPITEEQLRQETTALLKAYLA